MKNLFSLLRRFSRSNTLDLLLISFGLFLILKPQAPAPPRKMTVRIGSYIIWQGYVEPDTWCEVSAWEGSTLYKTQQVVYAQFKNLEKYSEKPLDMWGWVWYYDVGRKLTNEISVNPWELPRGNP